MKFRIVTDKCQGFEVQHKYLFWPFWIQTDFVNTHSSVEGAEAFARKHAPMRVVKVLD